jgi:serine/threonine protein kinase
MIEPGQQLGEYEILELLGKGGMGAVYKARQTNLRRLVAIKTLQPSLASEPEYVQRFHNEAVAAAALNHPNLVQVYAAGETNGIHWFAMEYVEGESVQARMKRQSRLSAEEALAICMHVAAGLEYGWRKARLIHRDIKPDNIFLSMDGEVKLGDLGLAKSTSQEQSLTMTGASMGTPNYISPEQAEGAKEIGIGTDIYSLGCSLFHMIAGSAPYSADSAFSIMMKHVSAPIVDLRQVWPECPATLAAVLVKMMQKSPANRQQSYEELLAELRHAYENLNEPSAAQQHEAPVAEPRPVDHQTKEASEPTAARSAVRKQARSKVAAPRVLAAVGAAVVALSVAGMILFTKKSSVKGSHKSRPATASGSSKAEAEWRTLFDGSSLANWRGLDGDVPPAGWGVSNGVIKNSGSDHYMITRDSFEDFELELEWKADLKGNGGVIFWIDPKRAKESVGDAIEMQVGDPVFDPAYGKNPTWIDSGALWGMFPAVKGLAVTGQWNAAKLVVRGNKGEHFINGKLACSYMIGDVKWTGAKASGPHAKKPNFALTRKGLIGIQSQPQGEVIYKNIRIRSLSRQPESTSAVETATDPDLKNLVARLTSKLIALPGTKVAMSKTEFTVGDWKLFLKTRRLPEWTQPNTVNGVSFTQTDDHPVVWVSWQAAADFCKWLSIQTKSEWRMPTNAEWDIAAGDTAFPWGNYFPPRAKDGNFACLEDGTRDPNSAGIDGFKGTAPVGSFPPNKLGFFDLGGNVAEWSWDGAKDGDFVLRGQCWMDDGEKLQSKEFRWAKGGAATGARGFRLVSVQSM